MSTIPKMAYMSRDSRFYITNPNTLTTVYDNDGGGGGSSYSGNRNICSCDKCSENCSCESCGTAAGAVGNCLCGGCCSIICDLPK